MNQSELGKYIKDPWDFFGKPEDLLEDSRFTFEEKLRILESWDDDQKELGTATGEGLGSSDANLEQEIHHVMLKLKENHKKSA